MRKSLLLLILTVSSTTAFANVNLQKTASDLVNSLYGRKGDIVSTLGSTKQSVRVSLTNNANTGSAIYRVEFKKLNLNGAEEEEIVSDIKVIYEGGN